MSFQVSIAGSPRAFACRPDQSVLAGMAGAGAGGVQVGCRSGGCGVCRVQVLEGSYECGTMSHAQVCADDRARGMVLACQLYPRSNLELRPLGKLAGLVDEGAARLISQLAAQAANRMEKAS